MKAHKLFAKEKSKQDDNLDNISEEVSIVVRIELHKAFDENAKAYLTQKNFPTIFPPTTQSSSKPSSGKTTVMNSTTMDNISEAQTDIITMSIEPNFVQKNTPHHSVSQEPIFIGDSGSGTNRDSYGEDHDVRVGFYCAFF